MMKVKAVATGIFGLLLLWTFAGLAGEVSEGDYFQVDANGEMVRIYGCRTDPYPQCDFRYEHPDGSTGPIIEGWQEDLVKMRDTYLVASGQAAATGPSSGPAPAFEGVDEPYRAEVQSCDPTEYAGIPPGSVPASDDLMRQLIRDYFTGVATDGYDVSVQIHGLEHGDPFINTMSILEGQGATLITNGAPENATIYPIRVQMSVCEEESQYTAKVRAHDWELYCFVNDSDQWACGVSQSY